MRSFPRSSLRIWRSERSDHTQQLEMFPLIGMISKHSSRQASFNKYDVQALSEVSFSPASWAFSGPVTIVGQQKISACILPCYSDSGLLFCYQDSQSLKPLASITSWSISLLHVGLQEECLDHRQLSLRNPSKKITASKGTVHLIPISVTKFSHLYFLTIPLFNT